MLIISILKCFTSNKDEFFDIYCTRRIYSNFSYGISLEQTPNLEILFSLTFGKPSEAHVVLQER